MADDLLCNVPQAPEFGNTPIAAGSAGIGRLGDNGGPTDTHDLADDSPAIGEAEPGPAKGSSTSAALRGRSAPTAATSAPTSARRR